MSDKYVPIQQAYRTDPWRVLVVCQLLNLTNRDQVIALIEDFFDQWPGPSDTEAAGTELEEFIKPLGFAEQRARRLRGMAVDYMKAEVLSRSMVQMLHGCGQYAADAFAVFCQGDLSYRPSDSVLNEWVMWRRRS